MNEIDTITAQKINTLHEGIASLLTQSIHKAIEIGELLTVKKSELPHGEFGTWIKDNLVFTDRTAQRYMNLFENKDKIIEAGNISEAYKMLAEPKNDFVSDLKNLPEITPYDDSIVNEIIERFYDLSITSSFWEWNYYEWQINIFYKDLNVVIAPSEELESKEIVLQHDGEKYPNDILILGKIERLLITRDSRIVKIIEFGEVRFGGRLKHLKYAYKIAGIEYNEENHENLKSGIIPLMKEINSGLEYFKICSRYMENYKGGAVVPTCSINDLENLNAAWLAVCRKESNEADDLETFNRLLTEATIIQNRLGELNVWHSRVMGQILKVMSPKELSEMPKNSITLHQSRMSREFAGISHEMFTEVIDKTRNRR